MRGVLSRLLLLVLGTAAGLAVCEVGLRVVGYPGDKERTEVTFDPRFGTVRKDSWIFHFEIPPGARSTEIEGESVPLPKPPGETRVLFVGDSGTEGTYVEPTQAFPRQLQAMFSAEEPDRHVRIINAGVYGMTTIDELHFLRERLLPLKPDIVVVGLFMSNDINFNLGHHQHGGLRSHSALAHFVYGRLLAFNATHRWFREKIEPGQREIPSDMALVDEYGFHMLNYPEGEVATYMKKPSPLVDHAFEVLEEAFRNFQQLGEQNGFKLRVVLIPTPSAISGKLTLLHFPRIWKELRRWKIHITPDQLDLYAPTRRVHAICEKLGIPCIDPTERLQRIGMSVFFPGDEHLTPIGHKVVAQTLFDDRHRLLDEP